MTVLDLNMAYARSAGFAPARATVPATSAPPLDAPIELCVVVPTYNERANLKELVRRIENALVGIRWEMIVVDDDSPDGTADHARAIHAGDARIRVIRRIGRRGLSSACLEGMLASSAAYYAVIDADLQHDPSLLTNMVEILRYGNTDLVCASRYIAGGSIGTWSKRRAGASRLATRIARNLTAVELSDPMSGFFAVRRELIDRWAPRLSGLGFKLLLDIVLTVGPGLRVREVPLHFTARQQGESKLSPRVAWDYGMMLADRMIGHVIPVRLIAFALTAGVGLVLHMLTLGALLALFGTNFLLGHSIASLFGLAGVYSFNNALDYPDRQRRGIDWVFGLFSYACVCAIGVAANVTAATLLLDRGLDWPLAAIGGVAVGMVWNYGAASRHTWSSAPC